MKITYLGVNNQNKASENKQANDKYQKYKMKLTYIGISRSKYLPKQIKANKRKLFEDHVKVKKVILAYSFIRVW